jgi:hypothetical protein
MILVAAGAPLEEKPSSQRLAADKGETEEIERLRFSEPTPFAIGCREASKLNQASLLRCVLFEVGELKLKLLQDRAAFGGLPELLMTQFCNRELQLLDQQRVGLCFAFSRRSARFRCLRALVCSGQRFALRRDRSACSRKRGRKRIGSAWHADDADTTPPAVRAKSAT